MSKFSHNFRKGTPDRDDDINPFDVPPSSGKKSYGQSSPKTDWKVREEESPPRTSLDTISSDFGDDSEDDLRPNGGNGKSKSHFTSINKPFHLKKWSNPINDYDDLDSKISPFDRPSYPNKIDTTHSKILSSPRSPVKRFSIDPDGHDDLIGFDSEPKAVAAAFRNRSRSKPLRPLGGNFGALDPEDSDDDLLGSPDDGFDFGGTTAKLSKVDLNRSSGPGFLRTDTRVASYSVAPEGQAIALYDFVGQEDGDLSFKKNDVIQVIKRPAGEEWWTGRIGMREGIFPSNYCEFHAA